MRGLLASFGIATLLLLGACGQKGYVAERPLSEVHDLLAGKDELPPVFGSDEPDLRMETADPKAVEWVLSNPRGEVMRFVATLTPEGERKTTVDLAVKAPPTIDKRLTEHPEIRNLYLAAMREQVEATLEGRDYDMSRIYPELGRAMSANIGNISRDVDAAAEAGRKRDEDNIRKAYAKEAAGE